MTVTLQGGNVVDSILYYSNASSVGYQAAVVLDAAITKDYSFAQTQLDTTAPLSAGIDVASAEQPALDISSSYTTISAANYGAIMDEALAPITLNFTSTVAGGTSVLAGSGGGMIMLADNSSATIAAGDGDYWIGHYNNTGALDVTLGDGHDTINNMLGNSTIVTGTGSSIINLFQDASFITLNGAADTVNAGVGTEAINVASGADNVLISENLSSVSFTNGAGASTIRGGGGATTINAGGTGSVLYMAESYDFFIGSGSLASLSDMVTDNSGGADTLIAGAGTTTIDASGSTGSDLLMAGSGSATLMGSTTTADTFEVSNLASGSHSITIDNWTATDTFNISGFGDETTPTPTQDGSNTLVTLNDGTVVTFTDTNASSVTVHTV